MSVTRNNNDEDLSSSPVLSGAILALTFVDTTWRLAVPSVGLTLLGVFVDQKFDTKPWFMFAGVIVGCVVAVYLVRLQLKNIAKGTAKKR